MRLAVIGGGPAGLRAAEVAASAGAAVTVYDAKPSVGRKFLVAGRGGLNITKAEPDAEFAASYAGPDMPPGFWRDQIAEFGVDALREWTRGLGVETRVASTRRVYPVEMKGAPLLRRWIRRLREMGVQFAVHHRWTGVTPGRPLRLQFQRSDSRVEIYADAAVLALGGASWPETGSDAAWAGALAEHGVGIAPFVPANCGWEVDWPGSVLAQAEGHALKNVSVSAGGVAAPGELIVTRYGLEGGPVYALGSVLREMPAPEIAIDFKPTFSTAELAAKMSNPRLRPILEAARCWKLSGAALAVLEVAGASRASTPAALAALVKDCRISLRGPRPIAEAISSAGGVRWSQVDAGLMLRALPGVFVAGEMLDWEAPTGGYLLHGCIATGAHAARGAVAWCGAHAPQ